MEFWLGFFLPNAFLPPSFSLLQSVREKCFDHFSAIYHLLLDKLKSHQRASLLSQNLPVIQPQRKSSITTGVGESPFFYFLDSSFPLLGLRNSYLFFLMAVVERSPPSDSGTESEPSLVPSPVLTFSPIPVLHLVSENQSLEKVIILAPFPQVIVNFISYFFFPFIFFLYD